jgi:hypothetical protein
MELRADPTGLAPERLMVFEVRGAIADFARAVRAINGLELIDEEELTGDEADKAPVAYLMIPDARALRDLEGLWRRWLRGELRRGETPWRNVFERLRDLRPWGPTDRVEQRDRDILAEEIAELSDDDLVPLEIELVFHHSKNDAERVEDSVRRDVVAYGGRILSRSRIPDIAYHALLVQVPARIVRSVVKLESSGIAGLEPVMSIRPQSLATRIDLTDPSEIRPMGEIGPLGEPILALLDGVPVNNHPLLARHLSVDDPFGLESRALVAAREHGTAMASLIVHGDRNKPEPPLPRKIHVVPVMGDGDAFPGERLIVDLIYTAVLTIRDGSEPTAPGVLIVNLSLGNRRQPFHGRLSPWARAIDRLSYRFGLLFLVSAGNVEEPFPIPAFSTQTAFEDAPTHKKTGETLRAIDGLKGQRRLIAPAETVNGVTVGDCNVDSVPPADRRLARSNIHHFPDLLMANL